jgi:hypothetical protein
MMVDSLYHSRLPGLDLALVVCFHMFLNMLAYILAGG